LDNKRTAFGRDLKRKQQLEFLGQTRLTNYVEKSLKRREVIFIKSAKKDNQCTPRSSMTKDDQ
jgi:hypothetical protein